MQATYTLEAVARYWNAVAARYLDLFRNELQGKPYDVDVLQAFAIALGHGARVCDAGCGPCGHVAAQLAGYELNVVGIDISPVCVALARQEKPSLVFETMDMGNMSFPDGSFDGLVSYYSIHYQPKAMLPGVLREFARVLRPEGQILLVAKEGQGEGFIDDPMGSGEQVFWSAFSDTELQELLHNAGFTNTSCIVRDPLPDEIQVRRIFVTAERDNRI